MPEDYAVAAIRHHKDGELLYEKRRVANADQLFGFSAECAIKHALTHLPGCASGGLLARTYHEDIDVLWGRATLQRLQERNRALVAVLKGFRQPFGDWSTDQRYEADGAVTQAATERHREVARRLLGSIGLLGIRREA